MEKYVAYLIFFLIPLFGCQNKADQQKNPVESIEAPAPVEERTTSLGTQVISAPKAPSSIQTNLLAIEEAYRDALPYMPFMQAFQIKEEAPCVYTFMLDYDQEEKNVFKIEMAKLDLDKMNIFFDQNGYPGIRIFSLAGQEGIQLSFNGGAFQPVEEMILKQDDRENTAKVTFALRDMIKKCSNNN